MSTASVVDEFECQLKCIGNNSCKSFNTHLDGNSAKRVQCELNSKTRQTNPGDFKWSKGSTYYGSVQVSVFPLKGTVTILSMILEIAKTYIGYWKLNDNGFSL